MEFSSLIQRQIAADRRRGFRVEFETDAERVLQLERDLIGLVGEIGEFANVLKKVSLALSHQEYRGPSLQEVQSDLREELADTMIYLMRLSFVLGGNLEEELVQKMRTNDDRYGALEH